MFEIFNRCYCFVFMLDICRDRGLGFDGSSDVIAYIVRQMHHGAIASGSYIFDANFSVTGSWIVLYINGEILAPYMILQHCDQF